MRAGYPSRCATAAAQGDAAMDERRATIRAAPPAWGRQQSPGRGFFYILLPHPREHRRVDAKM